MLPQQQQPPWNRLVLLEEQPVLSEPGHNLQVLQGQQARCCFDLKKLADAPQVLPGFLLGLALHRQAGAVGLELFANQREKRGPQAGGEPFDAVGGQVHHSPRAQVRAQREDFYHGRGRGIALEKPGLAARDGDAARRPQHAFDKEPDQREAARLGVEVHPVHRRGHLLLKRRPPFLERPASGGAEHRGDPGEAPGFLAQRPQEGTLGHGGRPDRRESQRTIPAHGKHAVPQKTGDLPVVQEEGLFWRGQEQASDLLLLFQVPGSCLGSAAPANGRGPHGRPELGAARSQGAGARPARERALLVPPPGHLGHPAGPEVPHLAEQPPFVLHDADPQQGAEQVQQVALAQHVLEVLGGEADSGVGLVPLLKRLLVGELRIEQRGRRQDRPVQPAVRAPASELRDGLAGGTDAPEAAPGFFAQLQLEAAQSSQLPRRPSELLLAPVLPFLLQFPSGFQLLEPLESQPAELLLSGHLAPLSSQAVQLASFLFQAAEGITQHSQQRP